MSSRVTYRAHFVGDQAVLLADVPDIQVQIRTGHAEIADFITARFSAAAEMARRSRRAGARTQPRAAASGDAGEPHRTNGTAA